MDFTPFLVVFIQTFVPSYALTQSEMFEPFLHRSGAGTIIFIVSIVGWYFMPNEVFRGLLFGAAFPPLWEIFDRKMERALNS